MPYLAVWDGFDLTSIPRDYIGVLFDLDGVLVDSMALHHGAWLKLGFEISVDWYRERFGLRGMEFVPQLLGRPVDADEARELQQRKEAVFQSGIPGNVLAMPGATKLVQALHADGSYRLAVASSTARGNIELILKEIGIRDRFHAIVGAEDVTRGKPDPEVFLTAAHCVDVPPDRCIVIEDAVFGVDAAHSAGMRAIAVATTNPRELLMHADRVVDTLAELDVEAMAALVCR
jgi:beta-phosphoglucomutase